MSKLPLRLFAVALLALVLAGCHGGSNVISVGLKYELVQIEREADGSAQVTWRIVNPNIVPYLVAETEHRITLNGTTIGTTKQDGPIGVPAQQNVERTTKLKVAGASGDQAIRAALATGSASYALDSTITIRLYEEMIDRSKLTNTGTVKVTAK